MAVRLYFRHRRVCCEQRELHWVHVRWVYELAGQLRVYLYEWIHWRRIQLHRCVSAFLFNNNKWIYNESYVCKLQNNCSCLPRKQDPSSDRTRKEWKPKRKLQMNRRDSDKAGGQEIKSRISEYWCTRHASTNNHSICACGLPEDVRLYLPWLATGDYDGLGNPLHLIDLLAHLYRKHLANVKVAGTLSQWFSVEKGVRQGCVLSPYLFNILAEMVMRETLDGFQGGLQIGRRMITNLRYADDIIMLATFEAEL